jgi:hypothetical protein
LKNLQVLGVAIRINLSPRFRNMKNSKYQCKKRAAGAAFDMRLRYNFIFSLRTPASHGGANNFTHGPGAAIPSGSGNETKI